MINSANKHIVSDIFSDSNTTRYSIPKYQREYTWWKDNWDDLLSDIQESDGSHFIWSIICINDWSDSLSPVLELVDWQQRLTTISLLFCSIYNILSQSPIATDDDMKNELYNLKHRLINKSDKKPKLKLSEQNYNYGDYQCVLKELGIHEFYDDTKNKGNRQIFRAYRYFLSKLWEYNQSDIITLLNKVYATILVKIEVNSNSDAFMLFESLNNRGIPLSAIDLIKNKLLAEIEKNDSMSIDVAFNRWKQLVEHLSEYPTQERYLRQYYNAFKIDTKIKVEGQSKATRSNLIRIYETLISRDTNYIFEELLSKWMIYGDIMSPNESDNTIIKQLKKELTDLANVKAAPSYLLLLYIFTHPIVKDLWFYQQVLQILVSYFIRRNITDFPNTRNLDQIFIDLVEAIDSDSSKLNTSYIHEYFTNPLRCSSDSEFERSLQWDLYTINTDATRFILSKIEESSRTDETIKDFWEKKDNKKLLRTIEHIFPEWENIPQSWVDMIADWNRQEAIDIQNQYVHKLGNLTLTWFNQSLSNFDFVKKRDRKEKDNPIWYKNGLYLNKDLAVKDSWTKEDIISRTKILVDEAMKIFKF